MKALWVFMGLFALGFAVWLIVDTEERTDLDPTDASFILDKSDTVTLQYVTGDPLPMERITLTIVQDDTTNIRGTDLALGDTWDAGGKVCIVGPDCLVADGEVTVMVFYDDIRLFFGTR